MKRIFIMVMVACLIATAGYGLVRKSGNRTMTIEETKPTSVSYNADKIVKLRKQARRIIAKQRKKISEYNELIEMFDSVGIPAVYVAPEPIVEIEEPVYVNWIDVSEIADVGVNWEDVQVSTVYSTRPYDERMADKYAERTYKATELNVRLEAIYARKEAQIESAKAYANAPYVKVSVKTI